MLYAYYKIICISISPPHLLHYCLIGSSLALSAVHITPFPYWQEPCSVSQVSMRSLSTCSHLKTPVGLHNLTESVMQSPLSPWKNRVSILQQCDISGLICSAVLESIQALLWACTLPDYASPTSLPLAAQVWITACWLSFNCVGFPPTRRA